MYVVAYYIVLAMRNESTMVNVTGRLILDLRPGDVLKKEAL